ncbi:MAG: DUF6502 family protein [Pseudomonadota bacterium]
MTNPEQALTSALIRLLRPVVRILMRYGMPYEGFAELAKRTFVDVAQHDYAIAGRKQSISRISTLTGIYRREVSRLLELPPLDDAALAQRHNRAARVIGGWLQDRHYLDAGRKPLALPLEGGEPSFTHLVRKYSGDIPVRAILDELIRVGSVEQHADGMIHLLHRAYVPKRGEADMLSIFGTDVADLVSTIDHNLVSDHDTSRLQLKVQYDNLSREAVDEFRQLAGERGRTLLEEFNAWLAQRDRDANPQAGGSGRIRAGLAMYYFEENLDEDSSP